MLSCLRGRHPVEILEEPGREILLADGTDDVIAALQRNGSAIGAAARAQVLGAHTADHRAAELEAYFTEAAKRAETERLAVS